MRSHQEDGVWCGLDGVERLDIKVVLGDSRMQKHQSLDACIHPKLRENKSTQFAVARIANLRLC